MLNDTRSVYIKQLFFLYTSKNLFKIEIKNKTIQNTVDP